MLKYFWTLLLLLPVSGFTKQPIGLKKWQHDDTTYSKQIGGAVRNYQRPDKVWDSIVNGFEVDGDSVVFVEKSVLRTRVNKNGVSKVMLTWDDTEYTVTQKMLGIGWIKISTRTSKWIDSTMNWSNVTVDSNIVRWTNVSPAVDYRVLKRNGQVEHGIFYKPAFLDSAVVLYNQRSDSLDIALANVMVYTLSANIDDADSAMGELPWRRLKDFGYYSFNLRNQRLRFPGCDTLPKIPVRQYWERRGGKIVCIEYVMMKHVKRVHEAYPTATIWHNDTKVIEGTTNVEDAMCVSTQADNNYGGRTNFVISSLPIYSFIRVKNVASEIGVGATITGAVCSVYCYTNNTDGDYTAHRTFKAWVEGDEDGVNDDDGDITYNDFQSDALEWTAFDIGGCLNDDGNDNSYDDGTCNNANRRNHKATAEDTETVDVVNTWYGWNMTTALAQGWYNGTINEEGVILMHSGSPSNVFYSTENGSNQPFWVFTYTAAAPAAGQVIMIQQ